MITVPYWCYAKEKIAEACLEYGKLLDLEGTDDGTGKPIDGARLLWAIAGVESSFGANCKPRVEPAYSYGGKYSAKLPQADLLHEFGCDAACSYGPWQIMLCNAYGYKPTELAMDLDKACVATVGFIRRWCINTQQCKTLRDFADAYNSGSPRDSIVPEKYIEKVRNYYFTEVIAEPFSKEKKQ